MNFKHILFILILLMNVATSFHLQNHYKFMKKVSLSKFNIATLNKSKCYFLKNRVRWKFFEQKNLSNRNSEQEILILEELILLLNNIGNLYGLIFSDLAKNTIQLSNQIKVTKNQIKRLQNQNGRSRQIESSIQTLNQLERLLIRKIITGTSRIVGNSLQFFGLRGLFAGALTSLVTFIIDQTWDYVDVFRNLSR